LRFRRQPEELEEPEPAPDEPLAEVLALPDDAAVPPLPVPTVSVPPVSVPEKSQRPAPAGIPEGRPPQ
jgi:hypothetical protein